MIYLYIYLASSILFRLLIIGLHKKKIETIVLPGNINPLWMAKCLSLVPVINTLMIAHFILRRFHTLLKRMLCRHCNKTFIRNIYGDEINHLDCRSLWKCDDCKKQIKSDYLHKNENND